MYCSTTTPTIYLAGKVADRGSSRDNYAEARGKWALARDAGLFTRFNVVGSDGDNHGSHRIICDQGDGEWGAYREDVQYYALDRLVPPTVVLAWLDSPSSYGSVAELAFAAARGLLCFMIIQSESGSCISWENPMWDAYWFVANFPNVTPIQVSTWDEAVAVAQRIFAPRVVTESPVEELMLKALVALNLVPETQFQEAHYRMDFAFPDKRLGIEIDGHNYHKTKEQRQHDAQRDRFLSARGWTVLRFTGSEVFRNPNRCANEIATALSQR